MAMTSFDDLLTMISTDLPTNGANGITAADLRGVLNAVVGSVPNLEYTFVASDNTGATDVTSELDALLAQAAGKAVFVPPGVYKINDLNPDYSVNLFAEPGTATFVFDIEKQCINAVTNQQAYINNSPVQKSVSAIAYSDFVDGYSFTSDTDQVSVLTVANVTGLRVGDIMHICSDNFEPWGDSRYGECFTILGLASDKIYVNGRLEFHDYYSTSITVTKVKEDRTFKVNGLTFKASETDGWRQDAAVRNGNGGCAINLWWYPRAEIINCTFYELWTGACTLRFCPLYRFENNKVYHVSNYKTAAPDVLLGSNPLATISGQAYIYVSHTAHGFATGAHFGLSKASGQAAIGGIPAAEIYDKGVTIEVIGPNAYRFPTTTAATSTVGTVSGSAPTASVTGGAGGSNVNQDWFSGRLGYGINAYGSCYGGVAANNYFEQCRHAITTGGYEDSGAFSTNNWYKFGVPTKCVFQQNISYDAWGSPFDTHEQGSGLIFKDSVAIWPARGPDGGSYIGMGFQNRSRNTVVDGYYQIGGTYGLRFASFEQKASVHQVDNVILRRITRSGGNDGYGIILDQISSHTDKMKIKIGSVMCHNVEVPIQINAGHTVDIVSLFARNITTYGLHVAGAATVNVGKIDLANDDGTYYQYGIYSGTSASTVFVDKAVIKSVDPTSSYAGVFVPGDVGFTITINDIYVDGGAYGLRTTASAGLTTIHRGVFKNQTSRGLQLSSAANLWDLFIDGGATNTRGIDIATAVTVNVGKAKIRSITNSGIYMIGSSTLNADDLDIETVGGASTYGLYCNDTCTVNADRLAVKTADTGIRLGQGNSLKGDLCVVKSTSTYGLNFSAGTATAVEFETIVVDTGVTGIRLDNGVTLNASDVTVRNCSTVGVNLKVAAVCNMASFKGIGNVNDNFEGDQDAKLFVGVAYHNDGKSLIDAQKNTLARFGHVISDYRGNTAAANCHLVLSRSDVSSLTNGSGTASAGTSTTLTDSGKSWTTNEFAGRVLRITSGTGSGQDVRIASNTGTVLTIDGTFSVTPDNTSVYSICLGGSDVGIGSVFLRKDDATGLPQYIFNEQDTSTFKTIWCGDIIQDNWSSVSDTQLYSDAATTLRWNTKMSRRSGTIQPREVTATGNITMEDVGRSLYINAGSEVTLTLSKEAPRGSKITAFQIGAGAGAFAVESGGTLSNADSHTKTGGQNAKVELEVVSNPNLASAVWVLSGKTTS